MGPLRGGRPTVRDWTETRILFDGNSLVVGAFASNNAARVPDRMAGTAPISGAVTVGNVGVSGQTINDMRNRRAAYVDPYYVAGQRNILLAWEGTNSVCNTGRTGLQAIADLTAYIAEVRAVHPDWWIVVVTTLPRGLAFSVSMAADNAELLTFNAYLLANYRAMGANAVVDVRQAGSPVYLATFTPQSFESAPFVNYMVSDRVHMNDAGYNYVAGLCSAAMRRVPQWRT